MPRGRCRFFVRRGDFFCAMSMFVLVRFQTGDHELALATPTSNDLVDWWLQYPDRLVSCKDKELSHAAFSVSAHTLTKAWAAAAFVRDFARLKEVCTKARSDLTPFLLLGQPEAVALIAPAPPRVRKRLFVCTNATPPTVFAEKLETFMAMPAGNNYIKKIIKLIKMYREVDHFPKLSNYFIQSFTKVHHFPQVGDLYTVDTNENLKKLNQFYW